MRRRKLEEVSLTDFARVLWSQETMSANISTI